MSETKVFKHLCIIALVISSSAAIAGPAEDYCESEWGDIKAPGCIRDQHWGQQQTREFMQTHGLTDANVQNRASEGDMAARILIYCSDKWRPDTHSTGRCLRRKQSLGKSLGYW